MSRSINYKTKKSLRIGSVLSILMIQATNAANNPTPTQELKQSAAHLRAAEVTDPQYKPGLLKLKHVVLFRYADTVMIDQKIEVTRRFLALKTNCLHNGKPYIVSIVTGAQNSSEGAARNLEQGFIVTFRSEGDRNYYVGQPPVAARATQVTDLARGLTMRAQLGTPRKTLLKDAEEAADLVLLPQRD
jgi:hypothetical protein